MLRRKLRLEAQRRAAKAMEKKTVSHKNKKNIIIQKPKPKNQKTKTKINIYPR